MTSTVSAKGLRQFLDPEQQRGSRYSGNGSRSEPASFTALAQGVSAGRQADANR